MKSHQLITDNTLFANNSQQMTFIHEFMAKLYTYLFIIGDSAQTSQEEMTISWLQFMKNDIEGTRIITYSILNSI